MSFAPDPTPRGYSYFEDAVNDWQAKIDSNRLPDDAWVTLETTLPEAFLDVIIKGKYGRRATVFAGKGVGAFYKTSPGKSIIDKVASTSLNKPVQGAAAISHVSKIARSHGISTFGMMFFYDGKLVYKYCTAKATLM